MFHLCCPTCFMRDLGYRTLEALCENIVTANDYSFSNVEFWSRPAAAFIVREGSKTNASILRGYCKLRSTLAQMGASKASDTHRLRLMPVRWVYIAILWIRELPCDGNKICDERRWFPKVIDDATRAPQRVIMSQAVSHAIKSFKKSKSQRFAELELLCQH